MAPARMPSSSGSPFLDCTKNVKRVLNSADFHAYRSAEFDRRGRTAIMEEIVGKALTNSYHKRLAYLEGRTIGGPPG
jgi:hypothetical protein